MSALRYARLSIAVGNRPGLRTLTSSVDLSQGSGICF